jgi:hypothetical protein
MDQTHRTPSDSSRQLSDDERWLLNHVARWGSAGYGIRKLRSGKWMYEARSIKSPTLYPTKREATAAFERYFDVLLALNGTEAKAKALAAEEWYDELAGGNPDL